MVHLDQFAGIDAPGRDFSDQAFQIAYLGESVFKIITL